MSKEMSKKAVSDPKALQSIMLSLQRLMKIGIYYPAGHSIFEKAVAHFKHSLVGVAAGQPTIRFTIKEDKLHLQNIHLNPRHTFVQEFKAFLNSLNITQLEIDREINSQEIRTFIQALLKHRAIYKSAKGFGTMTLEDLPHSVRLQQVEYFTSGSLNDQTVAHNDGENQTVNALLDGLVAYNLTTKQLDLCRNLLNSISPESLPATNQHSGTIPITWSDVEQLIVNLVKKSETGNTKEVYNARQNLNSIASILSSIEESTPKKSSLEAIDLLVSLVKGPSEQAPTEKNAPSNRKVNGPPNLPVQEIEAFVQSNISPDPFKHYLSRSDQREQLTWLLQLLKHKHTIQVKFRIQQMLREILTESMPQDQLTLLISGIHHLLTIEDDQRLSVALTLVIEPLRSSRYISPLTVLERLCLTCSKTELKRLVPHIVNELLINGRQQEPMAFDAICSSLKKIPQREYNRTVTTPGSLAILQESTITQNLFYSLPKQFFPIFAPLLPEQPMGKTITNLAIQGFSSSPPDNVMKAVLPFFMADSANHLRFLFEYLLNGNQPEPPQKVRILAGDIVTEGLSNVSDEQRNSLAIESTIKNMAELRGDSIQPTLEMIVEQKNMLILPVWPTGCRKAAKEALSEIRQSRGKR